jgi:hypothetical protein
MKSDNGNSARVNSGTVTPRPAKEKPPSRLESRTAAYQYHHKKNIPTQTLKNKAPPAISWTATGGRLMAKRLPKTDKTGRSKSGDKFARLFLVTLRSPAWRALSPYAQRLYPWLLLEWGGPRANNNGRISFSVRQAADVLGSHTETARKAFLDLQAKGFLVVKRT